MLDINRQKTVSYTHLDVYKRQATCGALFIFDLSMGCLGGMLQNVSAEIQRTASRKCSIVFLKNEKLSPMSRKNML